MVLIRAFDDVPRRELGIRLRDCAFGRLDELVVHLTMLPVPVADPPGGLRIRLQRLKSLFLLITAQVHPELENQHAVISKRALEGLDALQLGEVLEIRDPPLHAIEKRARIARPQIERDGTGTG